MEQNEPERKKKGSYWNRDVCPECGSDSVETFSYKENEHEIVRARCMDCGAEWQTVRNDWGC